MLADASLLPEASAAARERACILLERALGPSKVLTSRDACERFGRDESEAPGRTPDAVVLAESMDDVAAALAVATAAGVPITPRAGGTGRSGGAIPSAGGIVLSLLGLSSIKDIDAREGLAVVEPGVVLGDFHHAVEREGLFYAPDPNSLLACTLGGNVAENAGGPRAFKYGVTRDWVLGLDLVLMNGERFAAGRKTRKGVTGYDVTSLLVGSEGTLGVFGDITVKLIRKPEAIVTLLALFSDVHRAGEAVMEIVERGLLPRCMELLDTATLTAMRNAGNAIDPRAGALLLMETDGDEAKADADAVRIADACEHVGVLEVVAAQSESQRARLWSARREMSPAVKRLARHKLAEDVVVPRRAIGALLDRVARSSEEHRITSLTYGHAGDGNLHVNFLWNDADELPRIRAGVDRLFRDVVELGGTLSGEHGIGLTKAEFLPLEQAPGLIQLQRDLKRVFDPRGLLNPGKIFPQTSHRAC
jgi:glycolate oxidase